MTGIQRTLSALLIAASLVCGHAAVAQTSEVWSDDVVVSAKASGPAVWRLRRGNSEVIVIGILPVFPKSQTWRTRRIENALKGAQALIAPPATKVGIGDMFGMMSAKNLPNKKKLKDSLPPALNARYEATAARAGISIKDFARDKPVWAGARLRREVLERRGLSADEPTQTIVRLAHRNGVQVRPSGKYKISPILKDVNAMDEDAGEYCMTRTLDDIDFDIDRLPKAAAAWSVGDTRTVLANYHGSALMDCLDGSGKGAAVMERSVVDAVDAIEDALQSPGKTVAIVPLAPLLRKGGALDRLRAKGVAITSPEDK